MIKTPAAFHDHLVKLHENLRTDFLEACGQDNYGDIKITEKAIGISVSMKRVEKLIDEHRVQTIKMLGD